MIIVVIVWRGETVNVLHVLFDLIRVLLACLSITKRELHVGARQVQGLYAHIDNSDAMTLLW